MKTMIACLTAVALVGCRTDQDLRKIMQEEIAKASTKTFYPSANVIGPYTPAVQSGKTLFVSGQIGLVPETSEFGGDNIEVQTKQALTNLLTVLRKAGFDSSDVVQCSVFLKDMKEFQKMNLIYGGFFPEGKYPTRTTVEVAGLPRNAKVEVACIAVKSN
jgi:2-iminobutanoate/2-iminopropanoate deaminase